MTKNQSKLIKTVYPSKYIKSLKQYGLNTKEAVQVILMLQSFVNEVLFKKFFLVFTEKELFVIKNYLNDPLINSNQFLNILFEIFNQKTGQPIDEFISSVTQDVYTHFFKMLDDTKTLIKKFSDKNMQLTTEQLFRIFINYYET